MAVTTANQGYFYRKSLNAEKNPGTLKYRIDDSQTLVIGDSVRLDAAGLVKRAGTSGSVLGVVVGIEDEKGINPFSLIYTNGTGATLTPDDTVVTASNNSTRASYLVARVIVDSQSLFYNYASSTLATTNLLQCFNNTAANSEIIDAASASDTTGQFQLISLDPDGDGVANKGLFRIAQSQLFVGVSAAAYITA